MLKELRGISVDRSQIYTDASGVNHFTWITEAKYQDMDLLALKSAQHFKGWWNTRAKTVIPCDSPGIQCADLTVFEYKHLNTSYYPLGSQGEQC